MEQAVIAILVNASAYRTFCARADTEAMEIITKAGVPGNRLGQMVFDASMVYRRYMSCAMAKCFVSNTG